jgi:uncharacterized protein YbjQ (UPF0145 family)
LPYFSSGELESITEAQASLRTLAVSRIQQEARILKADGVIGVKKHDQEFNWGSGLLQFTLVGTAVRMPGQSPNPNPFISTLSGQEFWSLYNAGFYPVGYAYGNSTFYQMATPSTRSAMGEEQQYEFGPMSTKWFNQELTDFTEAIDMTRSLAEGRLQVDVLKLNAAGVIDVEYVRHLKLFERKTIGRPTGTDMSVSIEITGTAIVPHGDKPPPLVDYRVWLT